MFLPYLALFGKLFHLTYHVSRWLEYGFMTLVMTMVSYPTSTDYDITMVLLIIYKISIMVSFLINHGGYMDTLRTYIIISLSNMVNRVYIYIYICHGSKVNHVYTCKDGLMLDHGIML